MATPGGYLINRSVQDANALLSQLEGARQLATRIIQRMEALGAGVLTGYQ